METHITGPAIKRLREARGLTQAELGEKIGVGSKAVSKWETARGLPDVSLMEPLAEALGVSVMELMNGEKIRNQNVCANMLRTKICVCPVCGNILCGTGSAVINCCGVTLPPLEAEEADEAHRPYIQQVEDELFVTVDHPMTKSHYISFFAYATADQFQLIKLYPEDNAQARIRPRGRGVLYLYCNRHGLMKWNLTPRRAERTSRGVPQI